MSCFFSGTDWSQLHDRGILSNYFLMLIVNFAGDWIAKVAFPGKITQKVTKKIFRKINEETVSSDKVISFLHNDDNYPEIRISIPDEEKKKIVGEDVDTENVLEIERTVLFVMDCNLVKEAMDEQPLDPFRQRYDEVLRAVREEKSKQSYMGFRPHPHYPESWNMGMRSTGPHSGYQQPRQTSQTSVQGEEKRQGERGKGKKDKGTRQERSIKPSGGNNRLIQETYSFTEGHARMFLNASVGYGDIVDIRMNGENPIRDLVSFEQNTNPKEYAFWLGDLISEFWRWLDRNFPGYSKEEASDLVRTIMMFTARLEHLKVIRDIRSEFSEVIDEMLQSSGEGNERSWIEH